MPVKNVAQRRARCSCSLHASFAWGDIDGVNRTQIDGWVDRPTGAGSAARRSAQRGRARCNGRTEYAAQCDSTEDATSVSVRLRLAGLTVFDYRHRTTEDEIQKSTEQVLY